MKVREFLSNYEKESYSVIPASYFTLLLYFMYIHFNPADIIFFTLSGLSYIDLAKNRGLDYLKETRKISIIFIVSSLILYGLRADQNLGFYTFILAVSLRLKYQIQNP